MVITSGVCQVLRSDEVPSTVGKNKNVKNNSYSKASKNVTSEASSESSEIETREKEDVKPRKKIVSKEKLQNSGGLKKGKRLEKEANVSDKKRIKTTKTVADDNSDAKESEIVSEDDQSELSAEKPVKVVLFICQRSLPNLKADQTHLIIFILLSNAEKRSFNSSIRETRRASKNSDQILWDEVLLQLRIF